MDRTAGAAGTDFLLLVCADAPERGRAGWLVDRIREAVDQGRLGVGAPLPPTRTLASDLGWSRGVVVEAYQRLREQGLVVGNSRAGTRISTVPPPRDVRTAVAVPEPPAVLFDLSPGVPDLTRFPQAAWLRAQRDVLSASPVRALRYGDPAGEPELRQELSTWLWVHRGVRAAPDEIVVVSGVAQSLALLAHVLTRRGVRRIGVEDPGSLGARQELSYWGLEPVPVPVDGHGARVSSFPTAERGADGVDNVVLLTPAHQYPTGVPLAPHRRAELLEWADQHAGLVVEDDYDAEHRYDRTPVASLHSAAPQRIAHTGSVSKTLAPGVRLGWLVPPEPLLADVLAAKHASDITSSPLTQLTLARLLADGAYEQHLRRSRRHQRQRRDAFVGALRAELPEADLSGIAAGLHVLLTFPGTEVDDAELAGELRRRGLVADPLSRHRISPGPAGLVLGYASLSPDRLRAAAATIRRTLGR